MSIDENSSGFIPDFYMQSVSSKQKNGGAKKRSSLFRSAVKRFCRSMTYFITILIDIHYYHKIVKTTASCPESDFLSHIIIH